MTDQATEHAFGSGEINEVESIADHPKHCICGGCVLEDLLEKAHAHQQGLRRSRDTAAIRASNKNTLLFIDAMRGHL